VDCSDVGESRDPDNAELPVDGAPESILVAWLESLEWDRLGRDSGHEPVSLEDPVNGHLACTDSPTGEGSVDPHRTPSRISLMEPQDAAVEATPDSL
jgi:hypothetical protein